VPKRQLQRASAAFEYALRCESMATIDEKLARERLSPAERACLIAQRREIAKATRDNQHVAAGADHFIAETAGKARLAIPTIYRDLQRVDALGIDLLRKIIGSPLDHGRQLDGLVRASLAEREQLVRQALKKAGRA
jgi:hypothetical protein